MLLENCKGNMIKQQFMISFILCCTVSYLSQQLLVKRNNSNCITSCMFNTEDLIQSLMFAALNNLMIRAILLASVRFMPTKLQTAQTVAQIGMRKCSVTCLSLITSILSFQKLNASTIQQRKKVILSNSNLINFQPTKTLMNGKLVQSQRSWQLLKLNTQISRQKP